MLPINDDALVHLQVPKIRSIARHAAPRVFEGMVMPSVAFYGGLILLGIWGGLVAAMLWSYLAVARRMISGRQASGLILLAAVSVTIRAAVTMASRNAGIYFLAPVLGEAGLGLAFLVSLRGGTPLAERLAADFVPFDAGIAVERMRRAFSRLTLLWALVFVLHAALGLWMLLSQSLEIYVASRTLVAVVVKGVAVAGSALLFRLTMRREGVRVVFG